MERLSLNLEFSDPEDYIPLALQPLTFNSGNNERRVLLEIVEDTIDEELEQFFAVLSLPTSEASDRVLIQPNITTVTIEDDDGKVLVSTCANGDIAGTL